MVGWHHLLNGHKFEQTPGDDEGQGTLACCSLWGHKQLDVTERLNNNNNLNNREKIDKKINDKCLRDRWDKHKTLVSLESQKERKRGYNRKLTIDLKDFPVGPEVKNPLANEGDMGFIPGLGRPHKLRGNYTCEPQLSLHSRAWEPQEKPLLTATRESPNAAMKTQHSSKISK